MKTRLIPIAAAILATNVIRASDNGAVPPHKWEIVDTSSARMKARLAPVRIQELRLQDTTIGDAVSVISRDTRCSVTLLTPRTSDIWTVRDPDRDPFIDPPPTSEKFSLTASDISLFDALDAICEKAGYFWRLTDNGPIILIPQENWQLHQREAMKTGSSKEERAIRLRTLNAAFMPEIRFANIPLSQALASLENAAHINFDTRPLTGDLSDRPATFSGNDVRLLSAVDALCSSNDLYWAVSGEDTLLILPPDSLTQGWALIMPGNIPRDDIPLRTPPDNP